MIKTNHTQLTYAHEEEAAFGNCKTLGVAFQGKRVWQFWVLLFKR